MIDSAHEGKIIGVKWRDSNMYITQCEKDMEFTVSTITSYGILISQNDEQIVIVGDIVDDKDVRRVIVIPKENIVGLVESTDIY